MKRLDIDRRDFLIAGSRVGMALCGSCLLSGAPVVAALRSEDETVDPEKLNYCGYTCPGDCKFKLGTLEDDVDLKRQAHKAWKIEDRYGIAFDPETAFCYGCKAPGKPEGVVVANCTVRVCAREKELDCCIQCPELAGCEKDLWHRFPDFKSQVDEMRVRYLAQA